MNNSPNPILIKAGAEGSMFFTDLSNSTVLKCRDGSKRGVDIASMYFGLKVDFAKDNDVKAIVKGLRAMTDFDYEFQMAQMNSNLADFETIFIPASPEYGYVSSSMVKEIDSYGGDISKLVPKNVFKRMQDDR